ncbi:hypothetical protein C8R44DRAFT_723663 [Mycena epipterygia]|nr:hypothetical protein C8R44DRAFT_723663 [Mycena epipterygia]
MVYIRGPTEDFDRLADASGDQGWVWNNLRHIYLTRTSNTFQPEIIDATLAKLTKDPSLNVTSELGGDFRFNLDFNSGDGLGFALKSRNNLDLLNTHVTRLIADFTAATSQKENGPTYSFTADKEIVLSAGTIGTPQILQLSGIGPKEVLTQAGITPIVDLPDVGRNLQDQAIFFMQWSTDFETLSPFLRFSNAFLPNNAEITPDGNWISVLVQSPTSSSRNVMRIRQHHEQLTIRTSRDRPGILHDCFRNWHSGSSIKTLRTFMAASAWEGSVGQPFSAAANLTSVGKIEEYIRSVATTVKHPVGTAKISKATEEAGVVSPDLTVKHVKGVRVVDAFIFPAAVAGFPQAEVYIVAERAAALIKATWSATSSPSNRIGFSRYQLLGGLQQTRGVPTISEESH